MIPETTLFLIVAATATDGLLAGASLDQSIKQLPARHKIGPVAYSEYSRASDLGPGILWYGILGVGAAVLTIAAAVSALVQGVPPASATPLYVAAGLALLHSLATTQAAPTNFSQRRVVKDEATLTRVFDRFERWQTLRVVLQVLTFGAMLWALARHNNELSLYFRPLFLLPFCFFAYRRILTGILATLLIFPTSMFWFPAPENPSPRVEEYLAWERQFLLEGSVVARVVFLLLVIAFFVGLATAFWRRSWLWGLAVINEGTLLKVIWSVAFGGAAGWASPAPSLFTLAVTNPAILLAVRWLKGRRARQEAAEQDAEREAQREVDLAHTTRATDRSK